MPPPAARTGPAARPRPIVPAVTPDAPPAAPPARPRWWMRCVWAAAHLALGFHLFSLALGPASTPPLSSPSQRAAFGPSRAYLSALHLDHQYHYFAPDPGPSTLLRYEGTRPDGTAVAGTLPDAAENFPRLLYHRYFMLTERLAGPAGRDPAYHAALARGVGLHTGVDRVRLAVLVHRLPEPRELRAGFGLDDPTTYSERPLGAFDLSAPPADGNGE